MNFKEAVGIILDFEGGYVNDPVDPGGETNFGISKRAHPDADIKNLCVKDAAKIYYDQYWKKTSCDELPPELRLIVFDCAVNQGVYFANKALQASIGVRTDGVIGPKTLKRLSEYSTRDIVVKFSKKRLSRYLANQNFKRYGRGWVDRLIQVSIKTIG